MLTDYPNFPSPWNVAKPFESESKDFFQKQSPPKEGGRPPKKQLFRSKAPSHFPLLDPHSLKKWNAFQNAGLNDPLTSFAREKLTPPESSSESSEENDSPTRPSIEICGHIDGGKSITTGRLIFHLPSISQRELALLREESQYNKPPRKQLTCKAAPKSRPKISSEDIDYLKKEREQERMAALRKHLFPIAPSSQPFPSKRNNFSLSLRGRVSRPQQQPRSFARGHSTNRAPRRSGHSR